MTFRHLPLADFFYFIPAAIQRLRGVKVNTLAVFGAACATLIGLPALASETDAARSQPNIILLMSDDQGWGDVGFNGNKVIRTPHLDSMAAGGLVMERFYSASPICSPARGSVLTGRHPFRYGIYAAHTAGMRVGERTIANLLQKEGYATGIFGKWHVGWVFPDEQLTRGHYSPPWHHGFEESFVTTGAVPTWNPTITPPGWTKWGNGTGEEWKGGSPYAHNGLPTTDNMEGDDSRIIMDRVIPFIRQKVEEGQPFLALVWFHTPHEPIVAGPEYLEMYSDLPEPQAHYYGAITAMDEQIGRLRKELQDLGIAENTLISFTSDNGASGHLVNKGHASCGPFRGSKHSPYEGGVRVPTVFEWPGRIPVGRTDFMSATYDYLPTILDYAGIRIPKDRPLDGISLVSALSGEAAERPGFVVHGYQRLNRNDLRQALIENRYKLVFSDVAEGPSLNDLLPDAPLHLKRRFGGEGLAFELYDLAADPGETNDLAAKNPGETLRMITIFEEFLHSVHLSEMGADFAY